MAVTSFARQCRWYRRALGANPLVRVSDRLEALVVLAVFVTALIAGPVATTAGAEIYDTGVHVAHDQAASRHAVKAIAVDGSTSMPADFSGPDYVRAQWHEGPRLRTEAVISPTTVVRGDTLTVWLDDAGKVVTAPLTTTDAKLSALGAAGAVWVMLVACSALVAFVVRRRLDASRDRAWERELRLMAHNDDGWANRQT